MCYCVIFPAPRVPEPFGTGGANLVDEPPYFIRGYMRDGSLRDCHTVPYQTFIKTVFAEYNATTSLPNPEDPSQQIFGAVAFVVPPFVLALLVTPFRCSISVSSVLCAGPDIDGNYSLATIPRARNALG